MPTQQRRSRFASFGDAALVVASKLGSKEAYKEIDVAIVKATNHDQVPPKEKHVRTIMRFADSAHSQDIKYLLDNIVRRTKGLEDWLMVLKAITVLHRIYREAKSMEVKKKVALWSRYHLGSLKNYKDNTTPQALDMSAFIRTYSLYLYEKFDSISNLEFDPALEDTSEPSKTRSMSAADLCDKFPKLQTVMYRAIGTKPQGVACHNNVVLFSFLMVITESFKIYRSTNDGVLNMLDKFFETDVVIAQQLFDVYKLSLQHSDELQDLYVFAKSLAFGSTIEFPKLEKPPESFVDTMSEYIADLRKTGSSDKGKKEGASAEAPAIDSSIDLLDFSEPAPQAATAVVPPSGNDGFGDSAFENNASFENNADFLPAPGSATEESTPDKAKSPQSGGINLDALYGLSANPAPSAAPQNAAFFGGMNQQAQPQMAGSPFNGMVQQGMQQGMAAMQNMMQQQPQMMQQGSPQNMNSFNAGFSPMGMQQPMGMAAAPIQKQPQFGGVNTGMGQQQFMGANNGFAASAGNPFASAATTSPSQVNQFNDLFSQQQQQQQPAKPQNGQSPSFDFLS